MDARTIRDSFRARTDDEALREARSRLRRSSCPRRYCWWWNSLSFNFDVPVEVGCELPSGWPWDHRPTCCASGNSGHGDYYEPREPHLIDEGFPEDYFSVVGKKYWRRKLQRRALGDARATRKRREAKEHE